MKTKEILDMSLNKVARMSDRELRKTVQQLMNIGNSRIKRMAADKYAKNSKLIQDVKKETKMEKYKPYFSMKNVKNTRGEMMTQLKKMKEFLSPNKQSHSVRGYKQIVKNTMEKLDTDRMPTKSEWKVFRQLERDYKGKLPKGYDSTYIQQMILSMQLDGKRRNFKNLLEEGQKRLDEIYERINEEESKFEQEQFNLLDSGESDGEEEDLPF